MIDVSKVIKAGAVVLISYAILTLIVVSALLYVGIHFIGKFWR